jgi:GNAT superfamily N-acetyltransferase
MDIIEQVSFDEIKACRFKPEPHTVSFVGKADAADTWYAYKVSGKIAGCISVADKHGGKYIGSVYTDFPYRRRGIAEAMIRFVADSLYPKNKCIAHCLITSKRIFEKCGFIHYKTVYYKHGTQYFEKREVNPDGSKP